MPTDTPDANDTGLEPAGGSAPPRSLDEQHTMVQHAIDSARDASKVYEDGTPELRHEATVAAIRNQEVQALTLIALELRELRILFQEPADLPM